LNVGGAKVTINGVTVANGNAYALGTSGKGGKIAKFGILSPGLNRNFQLVRKQ